jgi:hypothetical protein
VEAVWDRHNSAHNPLASAVQRESDGMWWWWMFGTVHVSPGGRKVTVWPGPDADEGLLSQALLGSISNYVMCESGRPVLHASSVAREGRAVLFLGPSGRGKSTLAAAMMTHGATVVADDVVRLLLEDHSVQVVPSIPQLRLWPKSLEQTLGLDPASYPVVAGSRAKRRLVLGNELSVASGPVTISRVFLLNRLEPGAAERGAVRCQSMSRADGLAAVLAHIPPSAHLTPVSARRLLPTFARLVESAGVEILSYPSGFEYLTLVAKRIWEEPREQ